MAYQENSAGYAKITKVTPEIFMEPVGLYEKEDGTVEVIEQVCFAIVWVEAGDVLFEAGIHKGETIEKVAARYRVGGYTDDRCIFHKTI